MLPRRSGAALSTGYEPRALSSPYTKFSRPSSLCFTAFCSFCIGLSPLLFPSSLPHASRTYRARSRSWEEPRNVAQTSIASALPQSPPFGRIPPKFRPISDLPCALCLFRRPIALHRVPFVVRRLRSRLRRHAAHPSRCSPSFQPSSSSRNRAFFAPHRVQPYLRRFSSLFLRSLAMSAATTAAPRFPKLKLGNWSTWEADMSAHLDARARATPSTTASPSASRTSRLRFALALLLATLPLLLLPPLPSLPLASSLAPLRQAPSPLLSHTQTSLTTRGTQTRAPRLI